MLESIQRPVVAAVIILAASGFLAGGASLRPAAAGANGASSLSIVSCAKTTACQTYKNSNTGPALEGDNTNTSSFTAKAGLLGTSAGWAAGVEGLNTNSGTGSQQTGGVVGLSTASANGVFASATGSGSGVYSEASTGDGLDAVSNSGFGLTAGSLSYIGLFAQTISSSQPAFESNGGDYSIYADGGEIASIFANNRSLSGFGLLSISASSGNAYPLVARDQGNNNLFYVDGFGNVFYHGNLTHFLGTRTGDVTQSYTPTAASPTIEDNGTARLVNGIATVVLDPAFAHSIDIHRAYQVMLTADGDTRGLYTSVKTPTSFTVREMQGGRSTLDFDYHIYAPSIGQADVRMREMTRAQAAAAGPSAVPIPRPVQLPLHPLR